MRRRSKHLIRVAAAGLLLIAARPVARQDVPYTAALEIYIGSAKLGSETVTVSRADGGFQISALGRLAAPVDVTTNRFEVSYSADWQPQRLAVDAVIKGQTASLAATFEGTTAKLQMDQAGQKKSVEHTVSPKTLVIPSNAFAAYEALAARLSTAQPGTRFPVYVASDRELAVTVGAITTRKLSSPDGNFELRKCELTFEQPAGPLSAEMWVDAKGHLARFIVPLQGIAVLRSDMTSVMIREERAPHPGDEPVFIASTGFNLAATYSKPVGARDRVPAVVLAGGVASTDRDEMIGGVPVFAYMAGALADRGYAVVRFDRRGAGQSGGRTENATLNSFAADLNHIVEWLASRKDVDSSRIAVAGYGDGGAVALLGATLSKRARVVALLGVSARTGREIALEMQLQALESSSMSTADRSAKIALQKRLIDAVLTGKGWENVPPELRKTTDTPAFRSWLQFDPVATLRNVKQPVVIVRGTLDQEVTAADADRLEAAGRARKGLPPSFTQKISVDGVNHLLYAPAAMSALGAALDDAFRVRR